MDFRILGPLEVLDEGHPLDLGHHKQRSLLALLLINANRVVPTDRILDEIWGEDAAGKENALWVYVSRLRSALQSEELLVTKDHGYTLQTPPDSIDARRFEAAVDRGRALLHTDAAGAAEALRAGLDAWRGSALQDFAFDDFARVEIGRLEELRLAATEDRIEADLRRGLAGELVAELEALHDEHPLRERVVEQLMLALYRAGRQADALRTFERFRRGMAEELGLDPSPELRRLEEQILLHDSRLHPATSTRPGGRPSTVAAANPFKGLRVFGEDDADDFFGRESLIADVTRRLTKGDRLIALVGPSGSGKSSLVRAGLLPTLRKGGVPGSEEWLIASMVPGAHPFAELEAALMWSTLDAPDSLADQLADDDLGLLRAALRLLPSDNSRLVLVVDQFEELFTLVDDDDVRQRFLGNLGVAIDDPRGRVIVVLTMRADFYDRPLQYPDFGSRLGSGIVNVVPLSPDELEIAALEPARQAGASLEPELLAELLADVIGQPGALPLFQYTLTELFDRRVGDTLAVATYRSMGGVRGALTKRADDLYDSLDEEQRSAAAQIFLRLVTITEDGQWSRRRVPAAEITSLDVDIVVLQQVIDAFGTARLLSFDRDHVSGSPTLEVAHEALLQEWEKLNSWIERSRDDVRRHATFAVAMREWEEAGRDPGYLVTGPRLEEYERWSHTSTLQLTSGERQFLDEALQRRRVESQAEEERIASEERLRRGARRRTWGLAAALSLLVAIVAAVLFVAFRPEGPSVGLVYLGRDGMGGVQDLLADGWEDAERALDFDGQDIVPLIDPADDIRQLAASGVGLIIIELFDRSGMIEELAAEFPETSFVVFGGEAAEDNITAVHFVRENGAYLMGVAAGLQSETARIGFIGGAQQTTTESRRVAYTQGARAVNPDVEVVTVYLGPFAEGNQGFQEIDLAREAASALYRDGVDVIHHSAGDSAFGIAEAAVAVSDELGQHLWVIGSETDEYLVRPTPQRDHVLTSMYKRWDKALSVIIEAYIAGELESGVVEFDIDSGLVAYSTAGGHLEGHVPALEAAKADLAAGTIVATRAASQPPTWTHEVASFAGVDFDGETCTHDIPGDLTGGSVVRFDIVNRSSVDVGVWVGGEGWGPSSWTAAGATNALAVMGSAGDWFIECFTEDGPELDGREFAIASSARCDLEVPLDDPADPASVILAYGAAITARDLDAVCSLIADESVLRDFFGDTITGGAQIAERLTPSPDDAGFVEDLIFDVEVAGNVVIWTEEFRTVDQVLRVEGQRATIVDGRIVEWIWGEVTVIEVSPGP